MYITAVSRGEETLSTLTGFCGRCCLIGGGIRAPENSGAFRFYLVVAHKAQHRRHRVRNEFMEQEILVLKSVVLFWNNATSIYLSIY